MEISRKENERHLRETIQRLELKKAKRERRKSHSPYSSQEEERRFYGRKRDRCITPKRKPPPNLKIPKFYMEIMIWMCT